MGQAAAQVTGIIFPVRFMVKWVSGGARASPAPSDPVQKERFMANEALVMPSASHRT